MIFSIGNSQKQIYFDPFGMEPFFFDFQTIVFHDVVPPALIKCKVEEKVHMEFNIHFHIESSKNKSNHHNSI